MAWMALGGTLKLIPQNIIHQVEATRVLGVQRTNLHQLPDAENASANMLSLAKGLCSVVLPDPIGHYYTESSVWTNGVISGSYPPFDASDTPFIDVNGDKELWLYLCSHFSPQVIRIYGIDPLVGITTDPTTHAFVNGDVRLLSMYYAQGNPNAATDPSNFPANAPVLDQNVAVQSSLTSDNIYPACLIKPTDPTQLNWLNQTDAVTKLKMPFCPATFLSKGALLWTNYNSDPAVAAQQTDNVTIWSLRGGIAAGMSVFSFLQAGGAQKTVPAYYNECELLQ
jgi:hypothetical protein